MSKTRRRLSAAVAALALAGAAQTAEAAGRGVALVIGNNDYRGAADLVNANKDARDMAAALRAAGFEVLEAYDADLVAFNGALTRFGRAIDPGEPAVVFYAGHGVQGIAPGGGIDSYLVPVDAEFPTPERIAAEAVALNDILNRLEQSGAGPRLVILDACRENVFARNWRTGARGLGQLPGLAAPQSEKLRGVFIAYATAPGDVAQDGQPGGNGVFTGALLKHLRTPGQPVTSLFTEVSAEVEAATGGTQQPWFSGSGTAGLLVLSSPAGAPAVTAATAALPADPVKAFVAENVRSPGGLGEIARSHLWGENGLPRDYAQALRYARQAAEKGDPVGAVILAYAHELGTFGAPFDLEQAKRWFQRAAEAGDSDAMNRLAAIYNETTPADEDAAARWARLSAESGNAKGMVDLGNFLIEDALEGVVAALKEAQVWLKRAADRGEPLAKEGLESARSLAEITGAKPMAAAEVQLAIKEYLKQPSGAYDVGFLYLLGGHGFPRDTAQGRRWMEQAANAGNLQAISFLGLAYKQGMYGYPRDGRTAITWLRRGAAQNDLISLLSLGSMHASGRDGLKWDLGETKRYYSRAAALGDPGAKRMLGYLDGVHLKGRAGPRKTAGR